MHLFQIFSCVRKVSRGPTSNQYETVLQSRTRWDCLKRTCDLRCVAQPLQCQLKTAYVIINVSTQKNHYLKVKLRAFLSWILGAKLEMDTIFFSQVTNTIVFD